MKRLLILITEFQLRLKAPFLLLLKLTHIVLLSLMLSATLLLLTQLLTLSLNMQFKLLFIIGLQNLDPHNISLLTDVLNIQTKIWPIYALFSILITHLVLHTPWTNGLVEFQNRNLGTYLRLFLQNPPTNLSFQTQIYAYAHNTTPFSQLKLSPYQIVFHTHPRIPLTFSLNLPRDSSNTCIASYCDSSPFIHTIVLKILTPFFTHS